MKKIKLLVEWKIFGVCSSLGERMGISTAIIRMWFIYITFISLWSPIIFYFILAFIKNIKRYISFSKRNPIWWR
ncbi:MAG: PspC domain-containing protein [Chitinophagaceae bacterium]|nr:PspC domain-containing protein [Chitinophagaceae bacterium]